MLMSMARSNGQCDGDAGSLSWRWLVVVMRRLMNRSFVCEGNCLIMASAFRQMSAMMMMMTMMTVMLMLGLGQG